MQKSRTALLNLINQVKQIKQRYIAISKDVLILSDKTQYDRTIAHYDNLITELEKEVNTRPIGYRYTGVYYHRKVNKVPPAFEKHTGTLYMQENQVSWRAEKEPGVYEYAYYRSVYKEPNGALITREDGEPVYKNDK